MNGSIKTLVAILVLVGGALETNSMDAAETSQRVVPDKEAKKLCFQFLKNELENYSLNGDVKLMLERLFEGDFEDLGKDIVEIALHPTPISCPDLVDFVEKVVNANDNCRWFNEHGAIMDQVYEVSQFDMRTSKVYLAYKVCGRLASLEIMKVYYQSVFDTFLESYKGMSLRSIGDLIADKRQARFDVQKRRELEAICEEILSKERVVVDNMRKNRPDSEERVLFDHILKTKFDWNIDEIKENFKAVRLCKDYLERRQSGQSVTEGTPQLADSNHDQMQE